jgi:hypothetical protein
LNAFLDIEQTDMFNERSLGIGTARIIRSRGLLVRSTARPPAIGLPRLVSLPAAGGRAQPRVKRERRE